MVPWEDIVDIPVWVKEHPAIKARGIDLTMVLKPGVAWQNISLSARYVVKALNSAGQEAVIYERLRGMNSASPNHTLPGAEVIHGERPLLILPAVGEFMPSFSTWDLLTLLRCYHQILEGVEFLHDQRIAHLDFCTDNLLLSDVEEVEAHPTLPLEAHKIYIMDFGESQQFELAPGRQPAIKLPPSHITPPNDMTHFDPYSWDMLCVGHAFQWISEWVHRRRPEPWIVRRLGLWLVGNERGCTSVCHCRPSARRARQVMSVMLWALRVSDSIGRAMRTVQGMFSQSARISRAQD
ncbi:hypothetical protein C8Q80DRAFT_1159179 [Daedaleopsis nitida]|nr:hypothetical protein C8Q80DRAFT_1159179 [Daedaleopsis nitida]